MRRREFLKYSAATAVAAPFVRPARADAAVVKVGVVGAKTGPRPAAKPALLRIGTWKRRRTRSQVEFPPKAF
jgi:hypothetical protein